MITFAIILFIIITICIQLNKNYESMDHNYLDGVDIIYWINLDRSPDRKISMEKIFTDDAFQRTPNQRILAIDGKNPDIIDNLLTIETKNMSNNEYACLLSHLESIRTFNNSDFNVALIMEDDATLEFKPYWNKSIKEIMNNAPNDWEIIMLSYNTEENLIDKIEYEVFQGLYHSSLAYIINKKSASKLINNIYINNKYYLNFNGPPYADLYLFEVNKTYVYKYPMFIYKDDNDSTISNATSFMNISKQNILSIFNKISIN